MEKCLSGMDFPKLSQAPKFPWILVNQMDRLDSPGGMDSPAGQAPSPGKPDGRQPWDPQPFLGIVLGPGILCQSSRMCPQIPDPALGGFSSLQSWEIREYWGWAGGMDGMVMILKEFQLIPGIVQEICINMPRCLWKPIVHKSWEKAMEFQLFQLVTSQFTF